MKLYAICLAKDEDDIIAQTLISATRYCDKIFVIDNGSSDRTWQIVQDLAVQHPEIVAFEQTLLPYSDALRGRVYNELHTQLSDNDWWLVLDADEFLAEDPRPILAAAGSDVNLVRAWFMQFYLTDIDLEDWERGRDDRSRPIAERRHYYTINWQEFRLFRNNRNLKWTSGDYYPVGLRGICKRRLVMRHYQYRDPEQVEKRLKLRYGKQAFGAHVRSDDWRSVVRKYRDLDYWEEGQPWRFRVSGIFYYYRRSAYYRLRARLVGLLRRARAFAVTRRLV